MMIAISLTIVAAAIGFAAIRWFGAKPARTAESMSIRPSEPLRLAVESIEDRIEAQLATLDELILEADAEITRLEAAILSSRLPQATSRALTSAEQQRCFAMQEVGFSLDEIADCLATTPSSVQAALDEWRTPQRFAA